MLWKAFRLMVFLSNLSASMAYKLSQPIQCQPPLDILCFTVHVKDNPFCLFFAKCWTNVVFRQHEITIRSVYNVHVRYDGTREGSFPHFIIRNKNIW